MLTKLRAKLDKVGMSQSELARQAGVSPAAISLAINHNVWPKRSEAELKKRILTIIGGNARVFKVEGDTTDCSRGAADLPDDSNDSNNLEDIMLLRKQTLTPAAKRAFGLARDPFGEVRSSEEVFLTPDFRYVREALRQTARHGGFIAVVGESGAGKSTLRKDLLEWIHTESQQVVVIEPYVLGMEDNDIKGKTLKSSHIAEAILAAVAPGEQVKRSAEQRFRQVHSALRESHRAGNRHVLIIEEAHGMPIPTLKHLKRFFELEDGFAKLLGIVLIGQPELGQKLDERNPLVREVVQRCEVVTLRPLDGDLAHYLKHRFSQSNVDVNSVLQPTAIEALFKKLSGRGNYSVLYPLAVHNVVTAALNDAADLGMPNVSAELIEGV